MPFTFTIYACKNYLLTDIGAALSPFVQLFSLWGRSSIRDQSESHQDKKKWKGKRPAKTVSRAASETMHRTVSETVFRAVTAIEGLLPRVSK